MRKAKTIFGSDPEGKAFQSIKSHLPEGWQVYPNLPFSQVVRVGKHEVSASEWDLYLKTSVDFTLVDGDINPSLIIEFDGMGGGFSSSDTYIQKWTTRDPNRSAKLNFKLRTCGAVGLPLMVISFDEAGPCTRDGTLSIINGIAAQHVATNVYKKIIQQWDSENRGRGKTYDEMMWDLARLDAKTQYESDPFLKRMAADWDRFVATGVGVSMEPLFNPEILTAMREKVPFESVGCRITAEGGGLPEPVVAVVWVRNWAGEELAGLLSPDLPVKNGVNPLRVAENIARCLGQERVLEVLGQLGQGAK
jgi:Protein of unknown function (DUF2726)